MAFRSAKIALLAVILALAGCNEIKARRLIQQGNKSYTDEKYDDAVARYEAALKLDPSLATGWWNLAIAHYDMYQPGGQSPENKQHAARCVEALNKYIALEPKDATAPKMLVGMYLKSANYDGALDFWKKAHDKAPTDPFPVAQIADTLEQAARYQESRDWYVKLAAMETKADAQADAWYRVGVSYQREIKRLGPGGSPEQRVKLADSGLAALEKASALAPDNTNYLTYAGILYRQRGFAQGKSYFGVVDAVTGSVYTKKVADIRAKKAAQAPTGLPGQTPTQAPAPAGNQKQ